MSNTPDIQVERMSDQFTKYHLNRDGRQPWPFHPVIHHFTGVDEDGPHDHPWNFTTHILKGSYVEEIYLEQHDGSWLVYRETHSEGDVVFNYAEHIHRIVELPEGEVWTMAIYEEPQREVRFWRFDDDGSVWSRPWNGAEFERYNPVL